MTVQKEFFPSARTSVQYASYVSESFTVTSVDLRHSQPYTTPSFPFSSHPIYGGLPSSSTPSSGSPFDVSRRQPAHVPTSRRELAIIDDTHKRRARKHPSFGVLRRILWAIALALADYIAHGTVYALLSGAAALVCTSAGYIFLMSREPYKSSNRETILCVSSIGGAAIGFAIFTFCWGLTQVERRWMRRHDPADGVEHRLGEAIMPLGLLCGVAVGGLLGAYAGACFLGSGLDGGLNEAHAFRLGAAGFMTVLEGLVLLVFVELYARRALGLSDESGEERKYLNLSRSHPKVICQIWQPRIWK
ncbi:uncharacterized protein C8Q71DRAFT_726739 [Rhodofomes roseus]|uniref:Uncharacterized protein n=1 Tax=Rhodofomes roseus TaxID=34475 RepID=A0ABQ8K3T2_9APHY|nr:uncharacterized protein C8Q71DRAFT_726739 [Rhodofomes roseus]KAH9831547.1 hypothetical protein C8Q71DRAFT_726739 [Rhodofomes roseus]